MMSFSLYTVACGAIPKNKTHGSKPNGAGMDASASHGLPGAQVALLQSPILPTVSLRYIGKTNFRAPPVDKPHTRLLASISGCTESFRLREAKAAKGGSRSGNLRY